jgi:hypothetical protein
MYITWGGPEFEWSLERAQVLTQLRWMSQGAGYSRMNPCETVNSRQSTPECLEYQYSLISAKGSIKIRW